MFDRLIDFAMKRTTYQAVGFYLAYFFLAFIIAVILGGAGITSNTSGTRNDIYAGIRLGSWVAAIFCALLTFLVIRHKSLPALFYSAVAGAAILSLVGGALLGMSVPAYLTTRPINTKGD